PGSARGISRRRPWRSRPTTASSRPVRRTRTVTWSSGACPSRPRRGPNDPGRRHGVEHDSVGLPPMTLLPHPPPRSCPLRPPRPCSGGRRRECGAVAAGAGVPPRPRRLPAPAGGLVVEDLGSTNGTFVNGRRITGPTAIRPGDRVTLGRAVAMPWPPGCGPAPVRVGRAPDNDLVAAHPAVSARHAVLLPHGAAFAVEDLGSANGTFVHAVPLVRRA